MSSVILETRLEPDRRLRCLVLLSGVLILLLGVLLVVHMPFAPWLRAVLVAVWIVEIRREMLSQVAGIRRVRSLRLDSTGRIAAAGADGEMRDLAVQNGTAVWRRMAWLRLRFPDNTCYGELLCGDPHEDPDWHRLQLIWQQSAAAFASSR